MRTHILKLYLQFSLFSTSLIIALVADLRLYERKDQQDYKQHHGNGTCVSDLVLGKAGCVDILDQLLIKNTWTSVRKGLHHGEHLEGGNHGENDDHEGNRF